jgi:hypothetical protein
MGEHSATYMYKHIISANASICCCCLFTWAVCMAWPFLYQMNKSDILTMEVLIYLQDQYGLHLK